MGALSAVVVPHGTRSPLACLGRMLTSSLWLPSLHPASRSSLALRLIGYHR